MPSRPEDYFLMSREWRSVRMQVLERSKGKCACCGRSAKDGARMNVDHIKPRIRYPELALTLDNLQVLCDACNHGKGNRYETDWRDSPVKSTVPTEDFEHERQRQLAELKATLLT